MELKQEDYKKYSYTFLFVWLLLIAYAILDPYFFTDNLTPLQALQQSSFTRVMFADIGVFSTISFFWILLSGKDKVRFIFAGLVLVVGSFALLPYLSYFFWKRSK